MAALWVRRRYQYLDRYSLRINVEKVFIYLELISSKVERNSLLSDVTKLYFSLALNYTSSWLFRTDILHCRLGLG